MKGHYINGQLYAKYKCMTLIAYHCSCSYHYDALGNLYRKNCSDSSTVQYLVDPYGLFGADIIAEVCSLHVEGVVMLQSHNHLLHMQIGTGEVTYFVQGLDYGLIAAWQQENASMLYYEYDGDG